GSALRFCVGEAVRRVPSLASYPWATLAVNVLGSLVLGWFLRWSTAAETTPQARAFVAIGLCGGFTTFSTFATENLAFLEAGQPGRAAAHALASVVLSVGAVYVGYTMARG
ncbi:MAG: fluoride efflux transporter CrcB, partial [Gemmatimonadota bacterium]|nr:fluoride efflux transporter CrcB [Gemmatimonadota bacterium]